MDPKDPRIRITVPDVAMRIAHDGPMYAVIIVVGVLAFKGITSGIESVLGAALALQARSRPPENTDKRGLGISYLTSVGVAAALGATVVAACS